MNADVAVLKNAILQLLAQREPGKTICPSEAARSVYPAEQQWRAAMPAVRQAAQMLEAECLIEITQGGRVVAMQSAKGAIRLKRR